MFNVFKSKRQTIRSDDSSRSHADIQTDVSTMFESFKNERKEKTSLTSSFKPLKAPDSTSLDPISRIVLNLLKKNNDEVRGAFAGIRGLINGENQEKEKQIDALCAIGGYSVMVAVMRMFYDDIGVQVEACKTLISAASGDDDKFALAAVRCGAFECSLLAMENFEDDESLQDNALRALYFLTATRSKSASVKLILDLQGLASIASAMERLFNLM
jgi:hypothetical protein